MKIRNITIIGVLVAFLAVSAQIVIPLPFSPVAFTMQTMVVMLIGLLLPPKKAALTILIYILAGAIGLPVFAAAKAGLGVLAGPTGGFLIGFPFTALFLALLTQNKQLKLWQSSGFCLIAIIILYIFGIVQLKYVVDINWLQAIIVGALPYLPFEVAKAVLASQIAVSLKKALPVLSKAS